MSPEEQLAGNILKLVGGMDNLTMGINCMTRLRLHVKEDSLVGDEELEKLPGVLGLIHDQKGYVEVVVGPGKVKKCMEVLRGLGLPASVKEEVDNDSGAGTGRSGSKGGRIRKFLRVFGEIFAPLIPGLIAAGLCAGFASMLAQLVPDYGDHRLLNLLWQLLTAVNVSFMTYLTAWAGYRTAEKFGGTPILGGMMGMIMTLGNIDSIAGILGLYNETDPLSAILRTGKGGVLAAVIGVFFMCRIEKAVRKRMPDALDTAFTPLLTLLASLIPFIFVVMPAIGLVSAGLCRLVEIVAMNPSPWVRMAAGYVSAALFLPLVAAGMHHGLIAIYTVQLETFGYVTLYPALAMAGAGQVGAAAAIAVKARKTKNSRLVHTINATLPAAVLGVGEPLIYGVTLPMGKPFITAGLGAGFGGAFVMLMEVASTTWGPSGLLGVFVMTEGPGGPGRSVLCYLAGLVISCLLGFAFTLFTIGDKEVREA